MKLKEIDLKGCGSFCDQPATFQIKRYQLPGAWDYIYTNGDVLWRLRHDGAGYAQINPVTGPAFFRPERDHPVPLMLTWIIPETAGKFQAFSNFWRPAIPLDHPQTEPDEYTCAFSPEAARYRLRHDRWLVETEALIPPTGSAVMMTVKITNESRKARRCVIMPVIKPHLASMAPAPWDVIPTYQTAAFFFIKGKPVIFLIMRDPGGRPARRVRAAVTTDLVIDGFEVSANRFIGAGDWKSPEAVWSGSLALKPQPSFRYGFESPANTIAGQPPLAGFAKRLALGSGRSCKFSVVFGKLPDSADGTLPTEKDFAELQKFLKPQTQKRIVARHRRKYAADFAQRAITTPDAALNQYVNEWLPLQLSWVFTLDRGWPTPLRGTRDAAQDATGLVATQPEAVRKRLCEIIARQRSDGWFLRAYNTLDKHGHHDARDYVDAGVWVWELARDYLCQTRDFALLNKKLEWLDRERTDTILEHLVRCFEYYIDPRNIGRHGLCKIREGDWNDGINRAGLEGRGETVMVTCQAIMGLEEIAELLEYMTKQGRRASNNIARKFRKAAGMFRRNLLKHAFNKKGYFNGVFTDAGQWVFSPKDPDGKARVSGAANSFAVIAGVAQGQQRASVINALNTLKGPYGWRLFYPGIGVPPIQKLGRIGQGDRLPGLSENGTPYNHGSHGFLGRAAWVSGRGSWLYDITRHMLPFDQQIHPVNVAKTPPYGVVNMWREIAGQEGRGGEPFLSGSITTAILNIYQGLIGFRPGLQNLVIDPCVPKAWRQLAAEVPFLNTRYTLHILNPAGAECGVTKLWLNGKLIEGRIYDQRLGRTVAVIPISALKKDRDCVIKVVL